MERLPPYLFGMINSMKMEKRRNCDDMIDLGMGNPIDPAPEAVTQKLGEVAQDIGIFWEKLSGSRGWNAPRG